MLLNPNVYAHTVDRHNIFCGFIKEIFTERCTTGFVGVANNCTTCRSPTLADLAVLSMPATTSWSFIPVLLWAKCERNKQIEWIGTEPLINIHERDWQPIINGQHLECWVENPRIRMPHVTGSHRFLYFWILTTRMWANAQRDGRPAEYMWHY